MCSSTKIYFDCIRQSERGVLLKGCNMKSRVCIRCSIMRASTNDDDVEATTVVEAATNNSDTIATAVPPVLTAPAAYTVPAVPIAPAATAVVPVVLTALEATTVPAAIAEALAVPTTAPAATAVVPVVLTALEATTAPAATAEALAAPTTAPAAIAEALAVPTTAPAVTAVVPVVLTALEATTAPAATAEALAAPTTAPAATAVVPVVSTAPAATAVVPIITPSAVVEPAAILTTTFSNTDDEPESALRACQFFRFQCLTNGCSSSTGADEERAVEAAIKGLSEFSHYINIDINYQGENIHGMINDEETHISPLGKNTDQLSSFRNRKGKVFYVSDLHPNRSCCADVLVVIAWKANIKDTFGIIHVLSFDDYIFCLENRYFTYFKEFLTIS